MILLTVESHIVELPFRWTFNNTLTTSPFLVSLWTLLVDESWGDLVTVTLSVVSFTSGEGWLQVEVTSVNIGLGSCFQLTEPKHQLVDVVSKGEIGRIDLDWWSNSLDEDTLGGLGQHFQDESILTVSLSTFSVGDVVDETWVTSSSGTLLGLWIIWPSLWTFLLFTELSLEVELESISADALLTLLGLLVKGISFWTFWLDTFVLLWNVEESWWTFLLLALSVLLVHNVILWTDNSLLEALLVNKLVSSWTGSLDTFLTDLLESFWT